VQAAAALGKIDLQNATLAQIAAAMKVAADSLRLEESLATAHVSCEARDARFILARLPAEVRAGLVQFFELDTGRSLWEEERAGTSEDLTGAE